jgi:hypothetical protein
MPVLNETSIMIKVKMLYIWSWRSLKDYAVEKAVI